MQDPREHVKHALYPRVKRQGGIPLSAVRQFIRSHPDLSREGLCAPHLRLEDPTTCNARTCSALTRRRRL